LLNHGIEYVRGNIPQTELKTFECTLKKTIRGTYVSVEPFHLGRYLDEQIYQFDERKSNEPIYRVLKADWQ